MSFILDALRKSEDERRREAVPGISRAPMAVPQDRLPRWALGVMAALAVCVLALGAARWLSPRPVEVPETAAPAAATAPPPPADIAAPPVGPAGPAGSVTAPGSSPVAVTSSSVEAPAADPETSAATRQAAAGAQSDRSLSALAAPPAPDSGPAGPLPRLGEIRAQGIAVPALELQLHSYATAADARFVFINGARYVEGDEVEDDLRVVAIRRDGAVLRRGGREFLLVPE